MDLIVFVLFLLSVFFFILAAFGTQVAGRGGNWFWAWLGVAALVAGLFLVPATKGL